MQYIVIIMYLEQKAASVVIALKKGLFTLKTFCYETDEDGLVEMVAHGGALRHAFPLVEIVQRC